VYRGGGSGEGEKKFFLKNILKKSIDLWYKRPMIKNEWLKMMKEAAILPVILKNTRVIFLNLKKL